MLWARLNFFNVKKKKNQGNASFKTKNQFFFLRFGSLNWLDLISSTNLNNTNKKYNDNK
jgi:hypothetical protein